MKRTVKKAAFYILSFFGAYLIVAYIILPFFWLHYEHHPSLQTAPKIALTKKGIPGDALNIGLVGTPREIVRAFLMAGWTVPNPRTWKNVSKEIRDIIENKPYRGAPVSNLYLWGKKQDIAFEKQFRNSPRQRHHVRFWFSDRNSSEGSPLWLGAATFDRGVGISRYTGEVTHHIAPDIDAERDGIIADLKRTGRLEKVYQVTGVGPTFRARNGEGDWYYTDGEMTVGVLVVDSAPVAAAVLTLPNPPAVRLKNRVWRIIRGLYPRNAAHE